MYGTNLDYFRYIIVYLKMSLTTRGNVKAADLQVAHDCYNHHQYVSSFHPVDNRLMVNAALSHHRSEADGLALYGCKIINNQNEPNAGSIRTKRPIRSDKPRLSYTVGA